MKEVLEEDPWRLKNHLEIHGMPEEAHTGQVAAKVVECLFANLRWRCEFSKVCSAGAPIFGATRDLNGIRSGCYVEKPSANHRQETSMRTPVEAGIAASAVSQQAQQRLQQASLSHTQLS
ncbi:hypothetical protein M9H77_36389 [Catharanthus roseus]|uniref:Uncharacterized protein n=1 Tax=Catharanthus roseus TaxID=4058 RepID=A0ACB9ZTG4_CATRO|nr:hypothetical protein M9H77_36389 [Catharanthus roseus]